MSCWGRHAKEEKVEAEFMVASPEKVAFDLMVKIAGAEMGTIVENRSRDYWLTLYHQCYLSTRGTSLDIILSKTPK